MDRRNFLLGAGTSSALVATGGLGLSRRAFAQSAPDPNIYNASVAAHAIATGNGMYVGGFSSDWQTVGTTLSNCLAEWNANGRDAGVAAAISSISPSMITSASLDQQTMLATLQAYQPAVQLADIQQVLSFVDANQALVPSVLSGMQTNGMSYYIGLLINQSQLVSSYLANQSSGGQIPSAIRSRGTSGDKTANPIKIAQPPPNEGGGYNCAVDGALIFAAGLAFATLSVMTLGSVDILAGAAWGGIALWGGIGTTGWGVGHVIAGCGF